MFLILFIIKKKSASFYFSIHPHGAFPMGTMLMATNGTEFSEHFPDIQFRIATIPMNYKCPIAREFALALGK